VSSQAWDCTNEEKGTAGGSVLGFKMYFSTLKIKIYLWAENGRESPWGIIKRQTRGHEALLKRRKAISCGDSFDLQKITLSLLQILNRITDFKLILQDLGKRYSRVQL